MENVAHLEGKIRGGINGGSKRRDRGRPSPSTTNLGICGRRTGIPIKKYIFKDIDGLENIEDFFQREIENSETSKVDLVEDSAVSMSLVSDSEKSFSQRSILGLSTIVEGAFDGNEDPPASSSTPKVATRSTKEVIEASPISRSVPPPSPFKTIDKIPRENRRLSAENGLAPPDSSEFTFEDHHNSPEYLGENEEPMMMSEPAPGLVESAEIENSPLRKVSKERKQETPKESNSGDQRRRKKRTPVSYTGKRKAAKAASKTEGDGKRRRTTPATTKPKTPPPEPVHISLDSFEPDAADDGSVRRGKRRRIPRLDWWKNEKVVYGRRDSAVFLPHIVEIIKKD
jgi:centromere protein C